MTIEKNIYHTIINFNKIDKNFKLNTNDIKNIDEYFMLEDYKKYKKILDDVKKKLDSNYNYYENILFKLNYLLSNNKNIQSILQYEFNYIFSINLLYYIHKFKLYSVDDNILIYSNNIYALDGLIYYQKYILNEKKLRNIQLLCPKCVEDKDKINFIKKNRIQFIPDKNKIINKQKFIIIHNSNIKENIQIFKYLEEDGNVLIYTHNLNKITFDLIIYISKYFEEIYIGYENTSTSKIYLTIILKKYINTIDLDRIKNFNGIVNNNLKLIYNEYEKFIKNIYLDKINFLNNINKIYDDKTDINNILQNNLKFSIKYAKRHNLSIDEWYNKKKYKNIYEYKSIIDLYKLFKTTFVKFKSDCNIIVSINSKLNNNIDLSKLFIKHESFYKRLEKVTGVELQKFNKIENNIKKAQQKLFIFLNQKNKKYYAHINGKVVSRAWIKVYEIYSHINFFKNFKSINAFFICEAPGNFISSTLYYLQHNTNIIQFKWMAQTLKEADVYDTYGFIKKTQNHWDYGQDKTGDITKYDNLVYYIKKYKNSDIVIGDCGLPWSEEGNINLGLYQLFYNLLIPKVGGNFILKTHALNTDLQFFSLLYIIYCKYEKVYFFRSSLNFYSPEIYIIGINFKGINNEEEKNLLKIFYEINNKKVLFPIDSISDKFIKKYTNVMLKFIKNYKKVKKKFVYYAKNPDIYNKYEKYINEIAFIKNKKWLRKNMKIFNNIDREYYKYYK